MAETTGGFYLHLENGPRTMRQLIDQGIAKCRRVISMCGYLVGRSSATVAVRRGDSRASRGDVDQRSQETATNCGARTRTKNRSNGREPSVADDDRREMRAHPVWISIGRKSFGEAYSEFQKTLQDHPQTQAADKIQFDSGAAAYKMKDYNKALESFSQALLSKDPELQSSSHYNLGNTLYQRGEAQKRRRQEAKGLDECAATLRGNSQASAAEQGGKRQLGVR